MKSSLFIGISVILTSIIVLLIGVLDIVRLSWSVASMSIIVFLGSLLMLNSSSKSPEFNRGEIRQAITIGIVNLYLVLVGTCIFFEGTQSDFALSLLKHLTTMVELVIGFYYGEKLLSKWIANNAPTPKDKE